MTSEKSEFLRFEPERNEVEVVKKSSVKRQYFCTLAMDLLGFSYGASCGWLSASVPLLMSDNTPLDSGPVTMNDAAWIASSICLGGFVGNLFIGWLSTKIGQKVSLCLTAVPQLLGWLLIYYARTPLHLIMSRLLSGFGGGGLYSIVPTYISEISDDNVRGTLGSTLVFACNLGICLAYILGEYVDYLTIPWLMLPSTLAFIILFANVPDSPTFLAKKSLYDHAERSLLYFRNLKKNSKYARQQIENDMETLRCNCKNEDDLTWDDFTSRSSRRALIYGICLMALNQFCGCFAMMSFTATIFAESGSTLSPNVSSIIVGVIQIIGSMFPTLLVDRLGRKMMMGISGFGTSAGLFVLGLYTFSKALGFDVETLNWIPLVAFSFVIFIANWGLMTLPFMIVSEITHPKIRGFVTILCMSFLWMFAFVALKYTPTLIDMTGMHGTMFLFSLNSLIGALFIVIFLPETKGKSFDEIVASLER